MKFKRVCKVLMLLLTTIFIVSIQLDAMRRLHFSRFVCPVCANRLCFQGRDNGLLPPRDANSPILKKCSPSIGEIKRTFPDVWSAYRNNFFNRWFDCLNMQNPLENLEELFMLLDIAEKVGFTAKILLLKGFNDWTVLHQVAYFGNTEELDHILAVAKRCNVLGKLVRSVDAAHGLSALQSALDSGGPCAKKKWTMLVTVIFRDLGLSALNIIKAQDRIGVVERAALLEQGGVICAGWRDD